MKEAAIYARVSTERQEDQRTIESQLSELRNACKKAGVRVAGEYVDDGFSGTVLARPGLDRLRDDASKGLFEAVYILSPDRLARKYVYQALVIEELKKRGIEVIFLNKPVSDTPEDQLLLGIEGLIAEYERAKILERTRRGRLHRAHNGEIMGGSAPYGYEYVPKTKDKAAHYRVNEPEAEIVRLIFALYLRSGSTARVVKELAARKIRTRNNCPYWSKGVIHKMLRNSCYTGTAFYNKRKYHAGKRMTRAKSEWVPITVPRIIDATTFRVVHRMLKNHWAGKRKRLYILSGLIRCSSCGSRYIGLSANQGRHSYYRCGNFTRRFPRPRNCDARPVKAEAIESVVLEAIKTAITQPDILVSHILRLSAKVVNRMKAAEDTRKKLISQRNILLTQKQGLLDLYLEGAIHKALYLERKAEIEERDDRLVRRIKEAGQGLPRIDKRVIVRSAGHFAALVQDRIGKL